MSCTPFVNADGTRGIMCKRGFTPRVPADVPEPPPGPDLRADFPLGQRVVHKIFGAGTVTKRVHGRELDDRAEILFETHGKKDFCMCFAAKNFKPADAP